MPKKRVLVISDLHCGHQVGLTPPGYRMPDEIANQEKFEMVRREVWKYFAAAVKKHRPYDILIINGDCLEGKGIRSGGTELITADRKTQCDIAKKIIEHLDVPVIRMTYGTASHTGTEEDWEDIIAQAVGAKIGSHEWFQVNGRIIDCKHKISSTQVPYGGLTPLAREIIWNRVWAARNQVPRADILIRSHAHTYEHCDHEECLGFITPALQGFGSKFGARECSKTVDIGIIVIEIDEKGRVQWDKEIIKGSTQIAKAERL